MRPVLDGLQDWDTSFADMGQGDVFGEGTDAFSAMRTMSCTMQLKSLGTQSMTEKF